MFRFRLLLLGLVLLTATASPAQTINTDAVTAYWQLTAGLRRNEPLTDQAWQQFLAVLANKIYVPPCFLGAADVERYRRALEVVYMPRYDSLLQVKLKAKSWYYVLINDYKQRETQYKDFVARTVQNPDFLEKMYAYEYLPARDHTKATNLYLAYVAISNDATSQEAGIVFSVYDTRQYALFRSGILEAHELHHRLRSRKNFGTIDPADEGLLWSLDSSQNEGLADLTDKRVLLEESGDSADVRNWLLKPAPAVIQQLDSTIRVRAAGGPATPEKFYRKLTDGTNGHLPGFFMARTIVRNGYRQPMLDHAEDPIAFALLYQKAARRDPHHPPVFSDASVRYLKQLARKYDKPRKAA